ncbi:GNAT family N-acetyltransferase [Halogeometricum borinquense]|uniref:Acyltransferase n=2 Tax=Halogeometricum borinquense TaxID=60847 RepID=E4NSY4_HALBP|nr:GNAT family N-acetyltransferase [Halogeometricum borinquense]ADQ66977.1 predicted acyltransferase [Halogeometricum borinquense DSM 11551]ELY30058.1 acyltransferase [Halogeometricum borinquense DSM 11551]QIB74770.1 GNAT family N-acetyltransferase [Halogeometricum borinquense]QIQ76285.1 GNAT family N-acetyltransferase [Halogeometricum borinquense]
MTHRNADDKDLDTPSRTGVFVAQTETEREDAFSIRRTVFVEEQDVAEELEWDEHDEPDADATHLVAYDDGTVVGAARVRAYDEETAKIERVVVAADRRESGWGRRIMTTAEQEAEEMGFSKVILNAQIRVQPFYESLGYEAFGDEFMDAEIPHISMRKRL